MSDADKASTIVGRLRASRRFYANGKPAGVVYEGARAESATYRAQRCQRSATGEPCQWIGPFTDDGGAWMKCGRCHYVRRPTAAEEP